jgi:hypothetical protein
MTSDSATPGGTGAPALPAAVDRAAFEAQLAALRVREKAHTREGDAIAAARRRMPVVEVDASLTLTGPDGPVTLLEAFAASPSPCSPRAPTPKAPATATSWAGGCPGTPPSAHSMSCCAAGHSDDLTGEP